jgi:hypothetical protein
MLLLEEGLELELLRGESVDGLSMLLPLRFRTTAGLSRCLCMPSLLSSSGSEALLPAFLGDVPCRIMLVAYGSVGMCGPCYIAVVRTSTKHRVVGCASSMHVHFGLNRKVWE